MRFQGIGLCSSQPKVNAMRRAQYSLGKRLSLPPQHHNPAAAGPARKRGVLVNQRVRGVARNERRSFVPPEDWHEPLEDAGRYRIIVQQPGEGFRHVLTPHDVRERLAQLPACFLQNLEIVQFSRMTRKKQCFPCYGMQWGSALYLYPIESELVEQYDAPPTPAQRTEARMYGGRWEHLRAGAWRLIWTEEAIRDFYLNNILIHELGHLVDSRNTSYGDRERYAEWFAIHYGYRPTRTGASGRSIVRRHG
jgi:hypothetical protein